MKYPKLENIKSRDDRDSWRVGFGQGLRPEDAPAAWTAAILPRWLAFVAANPSLRYSRSGGPCFHCGEPRKRYYGGLQGLHPRRESSPRVTCFEPFSVCG